MHNLITLNKYFIVDFYDENDIIDQFRITKCMTEHIFIKQKFKIK